MNSILKLENVSKSYLVSENPIVAIDNVSLEISEGEFISILGKSGSGKSTLMHILGLLDSPTSGKVYIRGNDVSLLNEKVIAKTRNTEIGFVFQSFNLLSRTTVYDNVLLPLKYFGEDRANWKQKVDEMLKLVELENRKHNRSNELSGGQKQRTAIARALINNPPLILADEPTGNLDTKTGREIINIFKELNGKGKTVVIVTHDKDIANEAKRKIVIEDGRILGEQATHEYIGNL